MNATDIDSAAALLVGARRSGRLLDGLPGDLAPRTLADAHAIQDATVRSLGEPVAGWKVGSPYEGAVVRGAILASRMVANGGVIAAASVPLLGVEAEVAFRFDRALPPREAPYAYDEVAAAVTSLVAIEIVDTRYRDYRGAPLIERIADCVSNGAFVTGTPVPCWRDHDLRTLTAQLLLDGEVKVEQAGKHPAGDPLLPAVDLVNDLRSTTGVRAGLVMTTGTFTGLVFAKPGQRVTANFPGFGSAEVTLSA